MPHKSKGYRRFAARLECFQEDIEVADIFYKNMEDIADNVKLFKGVTTTYPLLNRRQSSRHNRVLVSTHLKHTLYVSVLKEIYEEVMLYLDYCLTCGALTLDNPERLVGNDQKINMTANDILVLDSREKIVTVIMQGIFRKLESKRDTLLLINELNNRLGLNISEEVINKAMPYFDARHKFVHSDGTPDEEYLRKYPQMTLTESGKIKLNKEIMLKVFTSARSLVNEFERKMGGNEYFLPEEYQ